MYFEHVQLELTQLTAKGIPLPTAAHTPQEFSKLEVADGLDASTRPPYEGKVVGAVDEASLKLVGGTRRAARRRDVQTRGQGAAAARDHPRSPFFTSDDSSVHSTLR